MEIKKLTAELSVTAQPAISDINAIHSAGFRSIICNRPDGEGEDQPSFNEIDQAAKRLGLETRYLPAAPGKVSDEEGATFAALMAVLPKPVLAYCRTGMRSTSMWALSESHASTQSEILDTAKAAGFDLSALVGRIPGRGKV